MATTMRHFVYKLPRITASINRIGVCRGAYLQPTPCIQSNFNTAYSTKAPAPVPTPSPWQLMSAVCLERYPVITNELDGMQRRFHDMIEHEELEESYLSEHEVKVAHEMELLAKKKKGLMTQEEEENDTEVADTTALESEDRAKNELKAFVPASRTTEIDEKNNLQSLERKLDDRLILLVKCKLGDDSLWMMPQGNWQEGESLKQTAERVLISHCGSDNLRAKFMTGVPCGFFKFKYPKAVRKEGDKIGAKVFFFKARYIEGDFQLNNKMAEDYMWVTQDELDKYLNQSYTHKIKKFLLPITIQHPTEELDEETPHMVASKS